MKKNMILAALCILLSTSVATAANNRNQTPAPHHQTEQTLGHHEESVIYMDIIRELHLNNKKYQKVEALNRRASARRSNIDYRQELREILGLRDYNTYLERVNDRLTAQQSHRPSAQPNVRTSRR